MIKKTLLITILVSTLIFQSQTINGEKLQETIPGYSIDESKNTDFPIVFKSIGVGGEEHLRTNIQKNGGFEEKSASNSGPEGFNYYGSNYRSQNRSYDFTNDASSYSGRTITRGSELDSVDSPLYYSFDPAYLSESLDLELDYYVVSNPDINNGGAVYIMLYTSDGSTSRYLYYYLSANDVPNNSSNSAILNYNNTIGEWNHFSRNVTADFEECFGTISNVYAYRVYLRCGSPQDATGNLEAVFDNAEVANTTYNYLHQNGDFELGTGTYWSWYGNESPGYISLTDQDYTKGAKALNLTCETTKENHYSYVSTYDYIGYTNVPYQGYYFSEPNMTTIEFDWKYTEVSNVYNDSYANFRVRMQNSTHSAFLFWVLGFEGDTHYFTNYSDASYTEAYFLAPNFGSRGAWNRFQIDLYDYCSIMNLTNLSVFEFQFFSQTGSSEGDAIECLVDDFQFNSYSTGDPGFEQDHYWSSSYPLPGWWSTGFPNINGTTDSHTGNWAANVTSDNFDGEEQVYRDTYMAFEDDYFTDFWWKIDKMEGISASSYFRLYFEGDYELRYYLGGDESYMSSNSSNTASYLVSNFNEIGVWNNLVRNVVDDLNEVFTPRKWNMTRIWACSYSTGAGHIMSTIFDDIHFVQDTKGPVITSIVLQNTPTYYEPAMLNIEASDLLSGIDNVMIYYQNDSVWYSTEAILTDSVYVGSIPVSDALTDIKFYINATDKYGYSSIDDNLGAFYTYSVDDDIDPIITLTNPIDDSIVKDTILISANCSDAGSGIDYVVFYLGAVLLSTDSSYPYEHSLDTRTILNGSYTIIATVFDNAGNSEVSQVDINAQNDYEAPLISEVFILPVVPQYNEETEVIVAVGDATGVQNVSLHYKLGTNDWVEEVMTPSGTLYSATIPGAPYDTLVSYYVTAYDDNEQLSSSGSELSPMIYVVGDSVLPTLTVDGPPTTEKLKDEVVFQIEGADAGSGIATVQVLIDGSQELLGTSLPQEFSWVTTDFDNGERVVVFRVTDGAGNSKEITLTYTIDNPDGFIEETGVKIDDWTESFGVLIGAGGVVIIYLIAKLILSRRAKKS